MSEYTKKPLLDGFYWYNPSDEDKAQDIEIDHAQIVHAVVRSDGTSIHTVEDHDESFHWLEDLTGTFYGPLDEPEWNV
jgi:hypothetical protein